MPGRCLSNVPDSVGDGVMMKKILALIIAAALTAVLLCACGDSSDARPLSEIFVSIKADTGVSELVEFDEVEDLDRFYGVAAEDVAEFAGGVNNSGVNQEEIVLIKAADSDAAQRVSAALTNRLNAKLNETKSYNPEQYAVVEQCAVEVNDLYVSLIISENAAQMTEIYHQGIGV